jgi:hypothetical protein
MHYLSIAATAMLAPDPASAQGDICTSATLIACGAVVTGNTALFTSDFAPFCGTPNGVGGGVWYKFVGTGATVTASLCGSSFDTGIRIFAGTCVTLPCVAGNGDFCGLQSQVTWVSTVGTNYFILVHGFNAAAGPYTLSISCVAPPVPMCYSQTTVPYTADPYTGTALVLSDDIHSGVVNIGFGFCYNGSTYTQCVISSNNYVSFNLATAGTFSPWSTVVVPAITPTEIKNSILNPWQDLYPPAGGTITYQTLGVAPNRRFVVSYLNVSMFSCTTQRYTSQTVLYEGSNCIGSFILEKNVCAAWNGGNAVHALHNSNGTSATIVPGRNNTQWTATGQGLLFIPTCVPCSTSVTAQCLNLVLPVELLRFHGHSEGDANILEWATATEQNSDVFIVERADDGEHFGPMAVVNGAGNSTAVLEYSVNDPSPVTGMNYYRLRNVDLDGAEEVSEVVAIEFIPKNIPQLFPNPGSGTVNYRLPEGVRTPSRLELRDLSGRLVRSIVVTSLTGTLDLSGLAPGTYSVALPASGEGRAARFVVD